MLTRLSRLVCLIFLISSIFVFTDHSFAESRDKLPPKGVLFKSTDAKLKTAKEKMADILVPKMFDQGLSDYQKAETLYEKNKKIEDIQKYISRARTAFEKSIDKTKVAAVFFSRVIKARKDAVNADASKLAAEKWQIAEEKFKSTAGILERGDAKTAELKSPEVEKAYRDSELLAIQTKYLQETWALLDRAEKIRVDDYAPITLEKAVSLSKLAASLLKKNRYDQNDAANLAQQAQYEAEHAIYLARQIKKLQDDDRTIEAILLDFEVLLKKISESLNITTAFNNGMDIPVLNISDVIKEMKKENDRLTKILSNEKQELLRITTNKDMEIASLKEQVALLENRLNKLSSSQEILKSKVEQQRIKDQKISRISSLFSKNEGKVLIDGKNVIIRLYGLSFPRGKSSIEPRYFSLLSKVKSAFAEFPNSRIVIEGHTDAIGGDKVNQQLSKKRAESVRQYFLANSNILLSRIKSVGYGESRPVASNETREGQAKNRRIDIVIIPDSDI